MGSQVTPSENTTWAASTKLPNRRVTAGVVLATTIAAGWFSLRAFLATSYTVGGIGRSYQALLVSIVAGLVASFTLFTLAATALLSALGLPDDR